MNGPIARLALVAALLGCGGSGGESDPIPELKSQLRAAVVTTDFTSGSLSVFPLSDPTQIARNVVPLHSDAVVRHFGDTLYVLNRLGADNIQALDAETLQTRWQCSVGNGTNPHDIAVVDEHKAYVTRYESSALLIVDPSTNAQCDGFTVGEIDLGALADDDGIPEMDQMVLRENRLYVSLQRLARAEFFQPTEESFLAVIDVTTDQLVDVSDEPPRGAIRLTGRNPFSESQGLTLDRSSDRILVVEAGDFSVVGDGGIEFVDPIRNRAEGFIVTESDLGGNITDTAFVDENRAYAIVLEPTGGNRVIRFDPSTRGVVRTLLVSDQFLVDVDYVPERDEVYVTDRSFSSPGIRVFAGPDDIERSSAPIDTGLPPFDIVFFR